MINCITPSQLYMTQFMEGKVFQHRRLLGFRGQFHTGTRS